MLKKNSIKRWNPLLGEWVIIAPVTGERPWDGTVVKQSEHILPEFDPTCYLCPGVKRVSKKVTPDYKETYVFENDFPSFSKDTTLNEHNKIYPRDNPAQGICRVVCFSPNHNITLAEMGEEQIVNVVYSLHDQFKELSSLKEIENVLMFENKGEIIGVSNPHPHGQIYATDFIPRIPLTRYNNAQAFMEKNGTCLLCGILEEALRDGQHIVSQNQHFVAFVPYFARYTYEVLIMPRHHYAYITDLDEEVLISLASLYQEILVRYDNLFQLPFPNITIFQNAPCSKSMDPAPYHFHIEFCPPLRAHDKLKYMAGFETGGGNIVNPSLPCESAVKLRSLPTIHYTKHS